MKVTIEGRNGRKKRLITEVVNFMVREQKLQKSNWVLNITILPEIVVDGEAMGGATCLIKEGEIEMLLSAKFNLPHILVSVCHEMIHVKQYVKGWMKVVGEVRHWMNKPYLETVYEEYPWEVEAYSKANEFSARFLLEISPPGR